MRPISTIHNLPANELCFSPSANVRTAASRSTAGSLLGQPKHRDAGILARLKVKRVGEVQVQGDERAAFLAAGFNHLAIRGRLHLLPNDRGNIVAFAGQQRDAALVQVFIQLELHACASRGIST